MRSWLREPLLHFLLLGGALFVLYGWVGGRARGAGDSIVIDQQQIAQLSAGFARMYQRAPDQAELQGLIDEAIHDEIYYREAKALGLDRDDIIVRRRLAQKLQFVSENVTPIQEPSDAQLEAYLRDNPGRFQLEIRYSLTQIYLDPERHGARLADDARALLAQVQRPGASSESSGDACLMPRSFDKTSASELSRMFGDKFETALRAAPIGQWSGPLASGFGLHLVLVRERAAERAASLADVRDDVRRAWLEAQQAQANARYYADLRKRYHVTVARQ
ncbi:MAG TPA: peptidylprolyl isomerase [Polyangiaceae bacterium]